MDTLAEQRIPVVPLKKIRESPGAVALTFDDGFRNFMDHALPVLREYRFPATVFVVSGYCGRHNEWKNPLAGIPRLELMGWDELAAAAREGVGIGAHTSRHPNLTELPQHEAGREMTECRAAIEQHTGIAPECFAYPYGAANAQVRRIAQAHFPISCGTRLDFVEAGSDPAELPRLDVFYLRQKLWFDQTMKPLGRAYLALRAGLRQLRRCFP